MVRMRSSSVRQGWSWGGSHLLCFFGQAFRGHVTYGAAHHLQVAGLHRTRRRLRWRDSSDERVIAEQAFRKGSARQPRDGTAMRPRRSLHRFSAGQGERIF
jgi:hypothetical protein